MSSYRRRYLFPLLVVLGLTACNDPGFARYFSGAPLPGTIDAPRAKVDDPFTLREYGRAVNVGNGLVRTYVTFGAGNHNVPLEVGVAITEGAMEGLPAANPNFHAPADGHEHIDSHVWDLELPAKNPTPYRFVEFGWNPAGHPPEGIYSFAHFDFHFYTVPQTVRNAIDPSAMSKEQYVAKSGGLPPQAERTPFFEALAAPGTPVMAVPRMGTHWVDVRTPELQGLLGNAAGYRPFTTTFIRGSWDGRFIFDEPMITRAFILGRKTAAAAAQRDTVMSLPQPQRRNPAGYYPSAYRVAYDATMKEYRIALTQLTWRD